MLCKSRARLATLHRHLSSAMSYPIEGPESIMAPKAHGTSAKPCQKDLLYGCDFETADKYVWFCVCVMPSSPTFSRLCRFPSLPQRSRPRMFTG